MKYVIINWEGSGETRAVLLPSKIAHRSAFAGVREDDLREHRQTWGKPISAGFFSLSVEDGEIKVHAYGDSETLGLKSQPEDADHILRELKRSNG